VTGFDSAYLKSDGPYCVTSLRISSPAGLSKPVPTLAAATPSFVPRSKRLRLNGAHGMRCAASTAQRFARSLVVAIRRARLSAIPKRSWISTISNRMACCPMCEKRSKMQFPGWFIEQRCSTPEVLKMCKLLKNGRPGRTRTADLFRVNLPRFGQRST
jgi:hypothetical protein